MMKFSAANGSYWMMAVVVACLAFSSSGCGGGTDLELIAVEGTLFVDDQPFGPASIALQPVTIDEKTAPVIPSGTSGEDGTFSLVSVGGAEGAPAGSYTVVVDEDIMSGEGVPELEPLTVEITAPADGGTLKLDLKMTSKKGGKTVAGPALDDDGANLGPGGT